MWQRIDSETAKTHVREHISEDEIIRHESMVKRLNIATPERWRAVLIEINMIGISFTYAVDCWGNWWVRMEDQNYHGIEVT